MFFKRHEDWDKHSTRAGWRDINPILSGSECRSMQTWCFEVPDRWHPFGWFVREICLKFGEKILLTHFSLKVFTLSRLKLGGTLNLWTQISAYLARDLTLELRLKVCWWISLWFTKPVGEEQRTWTIQQYVTGLTHRDKQPCTLTFTPTGQLNVTTSSKLVVIASNTSCRRLSTLVQSIIFN